VGYLEGCPEHRFRFGWGHSAPRDPRRSLIGSVAHPDSEEDGHGGVSLDRSRPLTVSDLDRSVPWYGALFDAEPVLDEDTGPFRHAVWLSARHWSGSISSPILPATSRSMSGESVWITWRSLLQPIRAGGVEARLNELEIANGGIVDASYGSGLSFRDPDSIALDSSLHRLNLVASTVTTHRME